MKKLLFIYLISIALISCSSSDESNNSTTTSSKEYTVSLGLSGEITNIITIPLSKATTANNNLYGIQVYSCPVTNSTSDYLYYAYGLFDNTNDMTIKLLQGYKYKFVCTMVVDGKDRVFHAMVNNAYTYRSPFYVSNATDTLNNKFMYSTTSYMSGLAVGLAELYKSDGTTSYDVRSNIDRYYGESTDFVPADNKLATISMKRVSFGAKFIAVGLTEGKLKISMKESSDIYIKYPDNTVQDIFTFHNPSNFTNSMEWAQDDYTESVLTSITWTKADGTTVPLATQDIIFKRNMLTTITVKINDTSTRSGINITTENVDMGDGGNVTINSGNSGNTGVNPNQ